MLYDIPSITLMMIQNIAFLIFILALDQNAAEDVYKKVPAHSSKMV